MSKKTVGFASNDVPACVDAKYKPTVSPAVRWSVAELTPLIDTNRGVCKIMEALNDDVKVPNVAFDVAMSPLMAIIAVITPNSSCCGRPIMPPENP